MNDLQRFTPSNAVVHIGLSELDNLRANLVRSEKELNDLKEAFPTKIQVITKYNYETRYRDVGGRHKHSTPYADMLTPRDREVVEFHNLEDYQSEIRQLIEEQQKERVGRLAQERDDFIKRVESLESALDDSIKYGRELEKKHKEATTTIAELTLENNKQKEEIDSFTTAVEKLTEDAIRLENKVKDLGELLTKNTWYSRFWYFIKREWLNSK